MRVLVAAASRHGSTAEIAEEIAAELRGTIRATDPQAAVEVRAADQVSSVDGYQAAVLGSAVYLGHWLDSARALVESQQAALSRIPVWLFSSGPVGDPPMPSDEPVDVAGLAARVAAREHRLFAGKLGKRGLRFTERAVVVALRAPEGDFRDWAAIKEWAREVGAALGPQPDGSRPAAASAPARSPGSGDVS